MFFNCEGRGDSEAETSAERHGGETKRVFPIPNVVTQSGYSSGSRSDTTKRNSIRDEERTSYEFEIGPEAPESILCLLATVD